MVLLILIISAVMISYTKAQTAAPPTIPSCEHLQQIDGSVVCNAAAASSPLLRTFGGGGLSNFAGGFSGRFIYDVYCYQCRSVHYIEIVLLRINLTRTIIFASWSIFYCIYFNYRYNFQQSSVDCSSLPGGCGSCICFGFTRRRG